MPLDASSSLDTALKLSPVSFVYNDDNGVKGPQVGLIAEQVQQVDSRLVATDASGTPFTVKYENLTAILAGAIQKLFSQLSTLAATVASFADRFTTRELTFTRATGDEIDVKRSTTDTLCVRDAAGSTCITRAQLDAMLSAAGQSPAPPSTSSGQRSAPPDPSSATSTPATSSPPLAPEEEPEPPAPQPPPATEPPLAPEEEPEPPAPQPPPATEPPPTIPADPAATAPLGTNP